MQRLHVALFLVIFLWAPAAGAHGTPDLCLASDDPEEACGQDHTCDIFEEVSTEVGVCQGTIEETNFRTCDIRNGDADCPEGFVCRIGQLDPNIGGCLEDESESEDGHDHDGHDHDDHDHACSTAPVDASLTALLAIGLFGLVRRR